MILRWMTAGESHGPALSGILSGIPAGLEISTAYINEQLGLRQTGAGRSDRQNIELDRVKLLAGLRNGVTIGSPIALVIENLDHENWQRLMPVEKSGTYNPGEKKVYPRPGHADLAGMFKYGLDDPRNVLERASGRTTAMTVAIGSVCRQFLEKFDTYIGSRIIEYGAELLVDEEDVPKPPTRSDLLNPGDLKNFGSLNGDQILKIQKVITSAKESGDTLGGVVQAVASHLPPGLGSCMNTDERLDSRIAGAVIGIPGVKAVEIGSAMDQSYLGGKEAHDKFHDAAVPFTAEWYSRMSNFAGGIEGGMTNGEPVCVKAWIKPISTVNPPFVSLDFKLRQPFEPVHSERSDVAVVEPVTVVLEAVLAIELAKVYLEKFGGDTMDEVKASYERYIKSIE